MAPPPHACTAIKPTLSIGCSYPRSSAYHHLPQTAQTLALVTTPVFVACVFEVAVHPLLWDQMITIIWLTLNSTSKHGNRMWEFGAT